MAAIDERDVDETRAHARLPQMDIEVVHRKAREGEREFVAVKVELLSMERLAAMSDPFRLWGQMVALAWWPWLQGMQALGSMQDGLLRLPRKED
jgi:hypothetical protein